MYPVFAIDAEGQKLDGANRYTMHFAPGPIATDSLILVPDDV